MLKVVRGTLIISIAMFSPLKASFSPQEFKNDFQSVQLYRNGLKSVLEFVDKNPTLFPQKKNIHANSHPRTEKRSATDLENVFGLFIWFGCPWDQTQKF